MPHARHKQRAMKKKIHVRKKCGEHEGDDDDDDDGGMAANGNKYLIVQGV